MKYRWRVVWSDGQVVTVHYAVALSLAKWGAQKCIRERRVYDLNGSSVEVVRVEYLPEE